MKVFTWRPAATATTTLGPIQPFLSVAAAAVSVNEILSSTFPKKLYIQASSKCWTLIMWISARLSARGLEVRLIDCAKLKVKRMILTKQPHPPRISDVSSIWCRGIKGSTSVSINTTWKDYIVPFTITQEVYREQYFFVLTNTQKPQFNDI